MRTWLSGRRGAEGAPGMGTARRRGGAWRRRWAGRQPRAHGDGNGDGEEACGGGGRGADPVVRAARRAEAVPAPLRRLRGRRRRGEARTRRRPPACHRRRGRRSPRRVATAMAAAAAFRALCEEGCGRTEDDEKALE